MMGNRMVEKLDAMIKWTWLGPLLLSMVMGLCGAFALNLHGRVVRIEEYIINAERRDAQQQGQFDTIIFRLNKLSERTETVYNILLQHSGNPLEDMFKSRRK